MKLFKYIEFLKENFNTKSSLPSYEEAVELCTKLDSAFY